MRGSNCLFNSAAALRRVFISPVATEFTGKLALQRVFLPSPASAQQRCSFTTRRPFGPRGGRDQPEPAKNDGKLPRDGDITSRYILLRDEETGKLSEPQQPWDVLGRLNPEEQSLVMVMDPEKLRTRDAATPEYPICRIVDVKAERAAQQLKEKDEMHRLSVRTKELELNWAIAPNDLERSLKQLRNFLEKGYFVQVSLLRKFKRGKRVATEDEVKALLQRVDEAIKEISGVRETKKREGVMGKQLKLSLQGTKQEPKLAQEE